MVLILFIARRYAFSKHSLNFITVISGISIAGITIGVAALVIILSVFNGFQALVEKYLIGFDPHVRVSLAAQARDKGAFMRYDSLIPTVRQILQPLTGKTEVWQIAPNAGGKLVCVQGSSITACQMIGVDEGLIDSVSGIRKSLTAGVFELQSAAPGFQSVVMGVYLADKLRVTAGDTIALLSPRAIETAITQATPPTMYRAIIRGIFQSNNKEYDTWYLYTSLQTAQTLLDIPPNNCLFLDLRSLSARQSENAKILLQQQLPGLYRVETWYDLHKDLYNVMRFERLAAFVILSIIILVAVFNVFASLFMSVAEKRPEIGILKAMGATRSTIVKIFFMQGVFVGVVGTICGVVLGLALCFGQIRFGWFALDTSRYIIPAIPVVISWIDVCTVSALSLVLSMFAGVFPARRAGETRSAITLLRKERM